MRWIADADKERIEEALSSIHKPFTARRLLLVVLANMRALEVEQPNPTPRVVVLSEAELRVIYPERFTQ